VSTAMNILVSQNVGNIFNCWENVSFSRSLILHEGPYLVNQIVNSSSGSSSTVVVVTILIIG
jgi:hypothetical protein